MSEFHESPPYEQWETFQSAHLIVRYLPSTCVAQEIAAIAEEHERASEDILHALPLDYTGPVMMVLYPPKESLCRATARATGFAITDDSEVHALWISSQDHQPEPGA